MDAHGDKANPSGGVSQRKRRDPKQRQIEKWKTCTLFQPNKQSEKAIPPKNSRPMRELRQVPFCAVASASKSKEILNAKVIAPGKSKGSFLTNEPLKLSGGSK